MLRCLFLPLLILFMSGCSSGRSDPAEIALVFSRHSYAQCDLSRLEEALNKSGHSALSAFDPYAIFLPADWRPARSAASQGNGRTGMVLWRSRAGVVVVRVFAGSPAEAAGIKAGDRITSIDGSPAAGMLEDNIRLALDGSSGGSLSVTGEKLSGGELNVLLKRDFGGMPVVWGFNIPGSRTGYLRIINFSSKTSAAVKAEMNKLLEAGVSRVIIDLRGNCGGSLDELAAALAWFAPRGGTLFSAISRHPGYNKVFSCPGPGPYAGLKALLLTDSGTISRAEIFAATLREWGGAVVVGGTTGGNVSATRSFLLKSGAALRITVAHLLTSSGADLDGKGLIPDVAVQYGPAGAAKYTELPQSLASADQVLAKALEIP